MSKGNKPWGKAQANPTIKSIAFTPTIAEPPAPAFDNTELDSARRPQVALSNPLISLDIGPDGKVRAFCEAQGADDPGYYLDLADADPLAFQRGLFQALLKRAARRHRSAAHPAGSEAPALAAIVSWLEAHPPAPKPPHPMAKPTLTLGALQHIIVGGP